MTLMTMVSRSPLRCRASFFAVVPARARGRLAQREPAGRQRLRLQDRLFERTPRIALEPVWAARRVNELVEHHPERVDIRRRS